MSQVKGYTDGLLAGRAYAELNGRCDRDTFIRRLDIHRCNLAEEGYTDSFRQGYFMAAVYRFDEIAGNIALP